MAQLWQVIVQTGLCESKVLAGWRVTVWQVRDVEADSPEENTERDSEREREICLGKLQYCKLNEIVFLSCDFCRLSVFSKYEYEYEYEWMRLLCIKGGERVN